jgi:hypothetical protein
MRSGKKRGGEMSRPGIWCRHNWVETERFETPGQLKRVSNADGDAESMQRLIFGVTTILYACKKCGAVKTIEVLGKTIKGGKNETTQSDRND